MSDFTKLISVAASGLLAALALAGCGSDFRAATDLILSGETAPSGGGYRVRVLGVDGTPIDGIEPTFVPARSGEQNVVLLLESDALYDGNATVTARILVESFPTPDTAQPPTSVGHSTFEARQGETVELTLELVEDPRPAIGVLDATLSGANDEELRLVGNLAFGLATLGNLSFVAWAEVDEGTALPLGAVPSAGSAGTTYSVDGASLVGRDVRVFVTAEPSASSDVLTVPLGWTVYDGQTNSELQTALGSALGEAGDLAGAEGIRTAVVGHRNLAQSGADSSDEAEVRLHCEHVHNFLLDDGEKQELDGNGTAERPVSDSTGLITYLDRLDTAVMTIGEHPAQLADNADVSAASACITALQVLVGSIQTQAASVSGGTNVFAGFDTLSNAVDELDGQGTTSGLSCARERLQPLSLFELTAP